MEQFIVRSGSSNIFIIYNGITKTIKKTIYRKSQDKYEKELKALNILDKYQNFPKIIKSIKQDYSIYMTYCGDRISCNNIPDDWEQQVQYITKSINETNIVHGDINPGNICVFENIIYLIDFGNIRFYEDEFFLQNNFHQYREKQHRKLYNICTAISRKEDPWKVI